MFIIRRKTVLLLVNQRQNLLMYMSEILIDNSDSISEIPLIPFPFLKKQIWSLLVVVGVSNTVFEFKQCSEFYSEIITRVLIAL